MLVHPGHFGCALASGVDFVDLGLAVWCPDGVDAPHARHFVFVPGPMADAGDCFDQGCDPFFREGPGPVVACALGRSDPYFGQADGFVGGAIDVDVDSAASVGHRKDCGV